MADSWWYGALRAQRSGEPWVTMESDGPEIGWSRPCRTMLGARFRAWWRNNISERREVRRG